MSQTLGNASAIRFTESVIDQDWDTAEQRFAHENLVDQSHMIAVASDTGGTADLLDDWVAEGSPVGRLLRGATAIVDAWETRSSMNAELVPLEAIDAFHSTLQDAENDLFAAAEEMPESSIPWQHLLTSGRGLSVNRLELDERYVKHIELGQSLRGHMSFQQLISQKWAGSHDEMWEHAQWCTRTAPTGSPNHSLVATALIENHIQPNVRYDSVHELPDLIGKREVLQDAADKCYRNDQFDSETPEGAMALSSWFTLHYLMGDWDSAAELLPMLGDRFARFPMIYFRDASWDEIRSYVDMRLMKAA